jgi:hypothetical protein
MIPYAAYKQQFQVAMAGQSSLIISEIPSQFKRIKKLRNILIRTQYFPLDASPRTYIPKEAGLYYACLLSFFRLILSYLIATYLLHPISGLLYLALMKKFLLLAIVLLFPACGGHKISNHLARDLISGTSQAALFDNDIEVVNITQTSGSEAVVEAKLQTAFRLVKKGNHWTVQEARLGHGQWEKIGNLEQALTRIKIEETQIMLERIAEAIIRYKKSHGKIPAFKDYVSLSDLLCPQYLTPLIRLDAWRRPFEATLNGENTILLRSAGPDGTIGTKDDISRIIRE